MTQQRWILWFAGLVAMLLLVPRKAAAQSGTVTDDGFLFVEGQLDEPLQ
jgi:hypothetical protein